MNNLLRVKCPYCGEMLKVYINDTHDGKILVQYCDLDAGGCDKPVAIKVTFKPECEVYKLIKQ